MLSRVDSASLTLQTLFNKSFCQTVFPEFSQSACLHTFSLCLFFGFLFVYGPPPGFCVWWVGKCQVSVCKTSMNLHYMWKCDGRHFFCKKMVLLVLVRMWIWAGATCSMVLQLHPFCLDCMDSLKASVDANRWCGDTDHCMCWTRVVQGGAKTT